MFGVPIEVVVGGVIMVAMFGMLIRYIQLHHRHHDYDHDQF